MSERSRAERSDKAPPPAARPADPGAPEQHSIGRSVVLHLLPGALITLFFAFTAPVARGLGFPSLLAIFLAIPFVLIPFELGYLLREGRRRNGRLSLEGVVLYREPIPSWQFALLVVGLFVWSGVAFALVGLLDAPLIEALFRWLPDWFFLERRSLGLRPAGAARDLGAGARRQRPSGADRRGAVFPGLPAATHLAVRGGRLSSTPCSFRSITSSRPGSFWGGSSRSCRWCMSSGGGGTSISAWWSTAWATLSRCSRSCRQSWPDRPTLSGLDLWLLWCGIEQPMCSSWSARPAPSEAYSHGTVESLEVGWPRKLLPASTASLGVSWRMQTAATLPGCSFTNSP